MEQPHSDRCKEIFALLSEYLDFELPPDACKEIESHLEGCPPCIEFAESLRKTVDLCKYYNPSEIPAPLGADAKRELEAAYQRMLSAKGGRGATS